jgi:Flp pilus assembly protein TadB
LTAETRLSGNIMTFMPFFVVGGLLWIRPDFYKDVATSPVLQNIMVAAGLLLLVGIVLMRRVANIRV